MNIIKTFAVFVNSNGPSGSIYRRFSQRCGQRFGDIAPPGSAADGPSRAPAPAGKTADGSAKASLAKREVAERSEVGGIPGRRSLQSPSRLRRQPPLGRGALKARGGRLRETVLFPCIVERKSRPSTRGAVFRRNTGDTAQTACFCKQNITDGGCGQDSALQAYAA